MVSRNQRGFGSYEGAIEWIKYQGMKQVKAGNMSDTSYTITPFLAGLKGARYWRYEVS